VSDKSFLVQQRVLGAVRILGERVPAVGRLTRIPAVQAARAHADATTWRCVTVLCSEAELSGGAPAAELDPLRDRVEFRIRPASAGRGVELCARALPDRLSDAAWRGEAPTTVIRRTLRRTKELAETGEVLVRDPQPEGSRSRTLMGRLVDEFDARAFGEGVS
jgi:hypothetical protein